MIGNLKLWVALLAVANLALFAWWLWTSPGISEPEGLTSASPSVSASPSAPAPPAQGSDTGGLGPKVALGEQFLATSPERLRDGELSLAAWSLVIRVYLEQLAEAERTRLLGEARARLEALEVRRAPLGDLEAALLFAEGRYGEAARAAARRVPTSDVAIPQADWLVFTGLAALGAGDVPSARQSLHAARDFLDKEPKDTRDQLNLLREGVPLLLHVQCGEELPAGAMLASAREGLVQGLELNRPVYREVVALLEAAESGQVKGPAARDALEALIRGMEAPTKEAAFANWYFTDLVYLRAVRASLQVLLGDACRGQGQEEKAREAWKAAAADPVTRRVAEARLAAPAP